MKRKRGSKKGHKKGKKNASAEKNDPDPASAPVFIKTEDSICLDQNGDSQHDSDMDAEPPASEVERPSNISSIDADQPNDNSIRKAGPGRLKVKLKSSRTLEPHRSYSDIQTPSDTDKSNQQAALEMNNKAVRKEDSTYSDGKSSEMQDNISEMVRKKAGSIKIKSSKAIGLSSENSPPQILSERYLVISDDEKTADSLKPKNIQKVEIKQPYRNLRYNEKELRAALTVIQKVMKMDAAEPFNVPVDPVALGIPDYFDIIDTPMDFGTICHNLERGHKYMNSEDVFKDVQFIWENCYKYNNKGDYIVDLMKRVKKNFMKYWMAAALYLDKPSNGAAERMHIEDGTPPSKDKLFSKGKQKHKRRKHGIDLHKSDCLCAVCVVRRRRKEREKNSAVIGSQMKINANLPREFKMEVSYPMNHNGNDDGISSQDHSQETDANADVEEVEKEDKMDTPSQTNTGEPSKQDAMDDEMEHSMHPSSDNGENSNKNSQDQELGAGSQQDVSEVHYQDQDEERKQGESIKRTLQHIAAQENILLQENHSVVKICKSLFPSNAKSVWNGPHSLRRRNLPTNRDSPIHSALATFLNQ